MKKRVNVAAAAGLVLFTLLAMACSAPGDNPSPTTSSLGKQDASRELLTMFTVNVDLDWSIGENDDEGGGTDVAFDEDSGRYTAVYTVTLGPLSECAKPQSEQSADSRCSWSSPIHPWKVKLVLTPLDGALTAKVLVTSSNESANIVNTLPADAVPNTAAWRLSFSPEDENYSLGDIDVRIRRVSE